jgi:hypothetical protein
MPQTALPMPQPGLPCRNQASNILAVHLLPRSMLCNSQPGRSGFTTCVSQCYTPRPSAYPISHLTLAISLNRQVLSLHFPGHCSNTHRHHRKNTTGQLHSANKPERCWVVGRSHEMVYCEGASARNRLPGTETFETVQKLTMYMFEKRYNDNVLQPPSDLRRHH